MSMHDAVNLSRFQKLVSKHGVFKVIPNGVIVVVEIHPK
jgi:hypothetical protein